MEDSINVIIIMLTKCEIVTIYTGSLECEFKNARINLQNIRSHSTADKHPNF
jgi:hypothetical protein